MAVTPMAGYAETVQTKQIVNQSSEATVGSFKWKLRTCFDEEGNFTESNQMESGKEFQKRRNSYTLKIKWKWPYG